MEWQDEGIILHTQLLGERKQLVSLFTAEHGRHAGVLARSKKNTPWVHCGGHVKVRWNARLESHMGQWTFEPLSTHTAFLLESSGPLAALVSAATLCHLALPERHPYPFLYEKLKTLLEELRAAEWRKAYVFFERSLLEELGYGLNLKVCAVTGVTTNLIAVSPRTGRAVCKDVAMPYLDRLLLLPPFLSPEASLESPPSQDILEALSLIGHFLERHLLGRVLPPARTRLVKVIGRN